MAEVLEKKLTWKVFREMEFPDNDRFIYELINGTLVKKAAPKPLHQLVSRRMTKFLEQFLEKNPAGEFFYAPIDVFFDDVNGTQPDICYVSKERSFLIDMNEGILGAPDIIVEILSPGSVRYDRGDKKDLYEKFAVKEYWIIDPNNKAVEVYAMRENAYHVHVIFEAEGKAPSLQLPGFEVDLQELFKEG
ncbi:MAG: Uma2 family endonuclease [Bacteroidetes bacterium]|nr:Uma2 family endonuclease [Bacteroidota bacterium]